MPRPAITDYTGTLENPAGVFRTLGEPLVERDIYGAVQLHAGNSAAIFTYAGEGGRRRFLKCYIRPNPHLRTVYGYIERRRPALLPEVRLLRDEIFVHTLGGGAGWVDVVEGEWTEGETLGVIVARAAKAGDRARLRELADAFDALCASLLAAEWAHGDLKPENIIVRDDLGSAGADAGGAAEEFSGRRRRFVAQDDRPRPLSLTLIDCDAMWVPELAGCRAAESGTPSYRHPARTPRDFDKSIDHYPALLISASLHALALAPELYSGYHTPDTLLLSPVEILDGTSAAHAAMLELFARAKMEREYRMTGALASPSPGDADVRKFF